MKNHLLFGALLFCFSFSTTAVAEERSQAEFVEAYPVPFLRIAETYPNTFAARIPGSEQITGQAFQQDALLTYNGYQYSVYYNETRNVSIARRMIPLGQWHEVVLPHKNTANDAHNVISMGICAKDGTIHLAYDHHNTTLQYCSSVIGLANDPENIKWEAASFNKTTSQMVQGVVVPDVTYPRFISQPNGNLLFECRYKLSGDGDSYLREYNGTTHKWSMVGRYLQGMDATPNACGYINRMEYDRFGKLHVSWCWRDDFGGGSNHDLSYSYSEDDGRTWKDTYGLKVAETELMEPTDNRLSGACLNISKSTLKIETIPYNKGYINQEAQCVDSKGRVHIVNSHLPDGVTNSNWAESRKGAQLYHRFRESDGTWKKQLIKNKGNAVHSYCRVQLAFDAFDNAYVIANGAEIYVATPANNYEDWDIMSDIDKGRFISEPQIDRNLLLSQGVLSYVYVAEDQKIVVVDYLLNNPNKPNGTGLTVQYYADKMFKTLIKSQKNSAVTTQQAPTNTKSIRWTGALETELGESYTLYLQTNAQSAVWIDDVLVLIIPNTSDVQVHEINFAPIASHKHNISIESEATNTTEIALMWSSARTPKSIIPNTNLFGEKVNKKEPIIEPNLQGKITLPKLLMAEKKITPTSGIDITTLDFSPVGDYSLEVKSDITFVEGRGIDIDARAANGKGFRVSLADNELNWIAPLSTLEQLLFFKNPQISTLRFAVSNNDVHIYKDSIFITSKKLTSIGDIKNGVEGSSIGTLGEERIGNWAGTSTNNSGKLTDYGWSAIPNGKILFADANYNTSGSVRYMDITHALVAGGSFTGRLMTLRWDNSNWRDVTYTYPVYLEEKSTYLFSMLYELWGSASGAQEITVGVSRDNLQSITSKNFLTTTTSNCLEKGAFEFTTQEAGTYYITFKGAWGMFGVGDLSLKKCMRQPRLIIGKNYVVGNADMKILSVTYSDGAYAPRFPIRPIAPQLPIKQILPVSLLENASIKALNGCKSVSKLSMDPLDNYSIEVSATIHSAEGRGLDIEARDKDAMGFRTAQNMAQFTHISPISTPVLISELKKEKQVIRYAVEAGKMAHIYINGIYTTSLPLTTVGEVDESGLVETTALRNKIINGDFSQTIAEEAPLNWLSDAVMGGGVSPRVQKNNAQIPGTDPLRAAFVIKFDATGGSWYAYPINLKPETTYEFTFDLIAWGNNINKLLNVVVSSTREGNLGIIKQEQYRTPSVGATSEVKKITFTTPISSNQQDLFYISFTKVADYSNVGITNLILKDMNEEKTNPINGILYGKNYKDGAADIAIDYIRFDATGAFAPNLSGDEVKETLFSNNQLIIYSTDNHLHIYGLPQDANVFIYDMMGRMIVNKNINASTLIVPLSSSVYIVKVQSAVDNYTQKVIVK